MNLKIEEFGNYLLSINNDEEKKTFINGSIINHPGKLFLLKCCFRMEDETENKSEIVKDDEGLEKIIHKYSQLNEWINIYGLIDNEENKLKLNQYLNELLLLKSSL